MSVDGFAVTPAGSAESAIVTGAAKLLLPLTDTEICCPTAPVVRVTAVGARPMLKPGKGAASTLMAMVALWVSRPEVPARVTVEDPAAAPGLAVKLRSCAASVLTLSWVGETVIPAERLEAVTATGEAKPLAPRMVTDICPGAPPGVSVSTAGEAATEKSARVVGELAVPDPQPPIPGTKQALANVRRSPPLSAVDDLGLKLERCFRLQLRMPMPSPRPARSLVVSALLFGNNASFGAQLLRPSLVRFATVLEYAEAVCS